MYLIQFLQTYCFLADGVVDSSGMRFSYTATGRKYDGGILNVGQVVDRAMIIPPGAMDFRVAGECNSECTNSRVSDFDRIISVHA